VFPLRKIKQLLLRLQTRVDTTKTGSFLAVSAMLLKAISAELPNNDGVDKFLQRWMPLKIASVHTIPSPAQHKYFAVIRNYKYIFIR
jgi:hypothetical protein